MKAIIIFLFLIFAVCGAVNVSAQAPAVAHLLSTQGTLNSAGQYTQETGTFTRFVEGTPTPTPTPGGTPTPTPTPTPFPTPSPTPCEPSPGTPGGVNYMGIYTLSNNETGIFFLSVVNVSDEAVGIGFPEAFPENPILIEQGPLTITLQINIEAGTGNGTIVFTSAGSLITGTIVIVSKTIIPPTDPVTCGTPTPTPTPAASPTPTPVPTPTPTPSAGVEVSGRVVTPTGLGLRNAVVTMTDPSGARQTATTSSFGAYRFDNVRLNETYILGVASKRYRFASQVLFVVGPVSNFNFVGLE